MVLTFVLSQCFIVKLLTKPILLERRSLKKSKFQWDSNPWPLWNTSAMLYQLSYEVTHWERSHFYYWVHIFPWGVSEVWDDVKYNYNMKQFIFELGLYMRVKNDHCRKFANLSNWKDLAPNVWLHSSVGRASHWYFTEVMGLNSVEALIFQASFRFCFDWEDISNTWHSVSSTIQHLEFHQKYSATCRIFNSLLGVWISQWNTVSHV